MQIGFQIVKPDIFHPRLRSNKAESPLNSAEDLAFSLSRQRLMRGNSPLKLPAGRQSFDQSAEQIRLKKESHTALLFQGQPGERGFAGFPVRCPPPHFHTLTVVTALCIATLLFYPPVLYDSVSTPTVPQFFSVFLVFWNSCSLWLCLTWCLRLWPNAFGNVLWHLPTYFCILMCMFSGTIPPAVVY